MSIDYVVPSIHSHFHKTLRDGPFIISFRNVGKGVLKRDLEMNINGSLKGDLEVDLERDLKRELKRELKRALEMDIKGTF